MQSNKKRKPRNFRRKEQWQSLLSEYATGKLSQNAFCKHHKISISSFYHWKKKLSIEKDTDTDFIDISPQVQVGSLKSIQPINTSTYQIDLELGHGITLRIRSA